MPYKKSYHIESEVKEKKAISKNSTTLGTVVVNTGGDIILDLFDGDKLLAHINKPETGTTFPYDLTLEHELMFKLTYRTSGRMPFSITVCYDETSKPLTAEEHIERLRQRQELQR